MQLCESHDQGYSRALAVITAEKLLSAAEKKGCIEQLDQQIAVWGDQQRGLPGVGCVRVSVLTGGRFAELWSENERESERVCECKCNELLRAAEGNELLFGMIS